MSTHMQPTIRSNTFPTCASPSRSRAFPSCQPRPAFTLVELLVVIAILAMLFALLLPAIMNAVATARDAAIKSEAEMLHTAMMKYQSEYGELPPSDLSDTMSVRNHLLRLFPRINSVELSQAVAQWAQLSPAQSLVLWLAGYYDNPQFPLTNGGAGGKRNKLYDFDEARLYGVKLQSRPPPSEGYRYWAESIVARVDADSIFPVYVGPNCKGLPYVYFASPYVVRYPANASNRYVPVYQVDSTVGGGDASNIAPYLSSTPPLDMTSGYEFCHAETFQIIAPGRDGNYGNIPLSSTLTAPAVVGAVGAPGTPLGTNYASNQKILQRLGYPFTSAAAPADAVKVLSDFHNDNITDFAQGPLKAASEKVLQ